MKTLKESNNKNTSGIKMLDAVAHSFKLPCVSVLLPKNNLTITAFLSAEPYPSSFRL